MLLGAADPSHLPHQLWSTHTKDCYASLCSGSNSTILRSKMRCNLIIYSLPSLFNRKKIRGVFTLSPWPRISSGFIIRLIGLPGTKVGIIYQSVAVFMRILSSYFIGRFDLQFCQYKEGVSLHKFNKFTSLKIYTYLEQVQPCL